MYVYIHVLLWEAVVPQKLRGLASDRNIHVLQINFPKTEHNAGVYSQGKRKEKKKSWFIKKDKYNYTRG